MTAPKAEQDAVCRFGPLETQGTFIGERFCLTHGGHTSRTDHCERVSRPAETNTGACGVRNGATGERCLLTQDDHATGHVWELRLRPEGISS